MSSLAQVTQRAGKLTAFVQRHRSVFALQNEHSRDTSKRLLALKPAG